MPAFNTAFTGEGIYGECFAYVLTPGKLNSKSAQKALISLTAE